MTAKLLYTSIVSLDGSVADADGSFDWAAPDEEANRFVNDLERRVGTYLYGRRMYEVTRFWETASVSDDQPRFIQDYAQLWQQADKVVYSRTLRTVSTARTRIERDLDPGAVRRWKATAGRDISVGGPGLAASAVRAGQSRCAPSHHDGDDEQVALVDQPGQVRTRLELLDENRFGGGVVHLHYAIVG